MNIKDVRAAFIAAEAHNMEDFEVRFTGESVRALLLEQDTALAAERDKVRALHNALEKLYTACNGNSDEEISARIKARIVMAAVKEAQP